MGAGPWLIGSDFNVVRSPSECMGSLPALLPTNAGIQ